MKCKWCHNEIPANHVQQGGIHMGCANSEITLHKVKIDDSWFWSLETVGYGEEYLMTNETKKMSVMEYLSLPEFQGP